MAEEDTKASVPKPESQTQAGQMPATGPKQIVAAQVRVEEEPMQHYEEVSEYRIGEGPPPLPLIIAFVLIVIWAAISWIPFFGY